MFGASTAAPAASGGFSFGAGSSAAPAASSGFNFGSSAAPAASGGFNFGSNAAPAPATSSTGFGFGTTATSTAPAASTGFGFGASTTAAAPAAGTSSFSFGAPAAGATAAAPAASGGFNFGGTTAAPAATSSFGTGSSFSFGGAATGSASPKPSLFGQTTTPATGTASGSSLFGGFGTTAKPAGTGFGGFGTTTTTPSTGFGGFGTSTTTPSTGFGGFGTTATPAAGASAFGAAPAAAASTAPPPIILSAADASVAQLNTVKYAYQDPAQSRFKFLMYNQVDPTQRHLYVRPPHVSERLWTQAELDNPDPNNCVPVAIVGFPDLLKRIQAQQTHADKLNTFTDDLRSQLQEMEKHTRATEEKLEKCRHEHVQLFHALVKVMKDIEFLQNLGKPLQRSEMDLVMALKKLQTLLDAPGQYKARLNDVVALQRVQQRPQVVPAAHQLTPDDLQRMYQFLDKQRQGLEHLTSILQDDLADIKLMKETWRR